MPTIVRGMKNHLENEDVHLEEEEKLSHEGEVDANDLIPRTDISSQLTESLMNELSDKNWKVSEFF